MKATHKVLKMLEVLVLDLINFEIALCPIKRSFTFEKIKYSYKLEVVKSKIDSFPTKLMFVDSLKGGKCNCYANGHGVGVRKEEGENIGVDVR